MTHKSISMSLLLAIALGFSACGGGGTGSTSVEPKGETVDKAAPVFASNVVNAYIVEENSARDIATISVTDESAVTFSLEGADKDYFELADTKVRSVYETTLRFKQTPDYEAQSSYTVTVVAVDDVGNRSEKTISIVLQDQPFAFDTTGNLGSVVENQTVTLPLTTVEAKGSVHFTLTGSNAFLIDGNQLKFKAPMHINGEENVYRAVVKASDGDKIIELPVVATVILNGSQPEPKVHHVKTRRDIDGVEYTQYTYSYDADGYLVSVTKTGTDYPTPETTTFVYSQDHKIMKGYTDARRGSKLKSIRVFEDKKTSKSKFAASIDLRLSMDEQVNYMTYKYDTAALKNNRHLTMYVHGLEIGQRKAELYVYNDRDQLSRILKGKFTISSEAFAALSDTELQTNIAPASGYPSSDTKLSNAQLNSLSQGTLPVSISYETTFEYDGNHKLVKRNYFGYAEPDKKSDDITVNYYTNGVIKEIKTNGVSIKYNTESLLDSINSVKYSYIKHNSETNVTVKDGDKMLTTYIFEEE